MIGSSVINKLGFFCHDSSIFIVIAWLCVISFSQSYSKNDADERSHGPVLHKGSQGNGAYVATAPGGTLLPDFPKPSKLTLPEKVPHEKASSFWAKIRSNFIKTEIQTGMTNTIRNNKAYHEVFS